MKALSNKQKTVIESIEQHLTIFILKKKPKPNIKNFKSNLIFTAFDKFTRSEVKNLWNI